MIKYKFSPKVKEYAGKYKDFFAAVNELRTRPDDELIVTGIGEKEELLRWQAALGVIRPGGANGAVSYPVITDFTIVSSVEIIRGEYVLRVWLTEPETVMG